MSAIPGGTRVTLDLSAATREKLFTLEHPDRAVIDLGRTRVAGGLRLPLGAGVVSGLRIGTQPGGTLRVVMQLTSPSAARTVWTQSGRSGRKL
ncbi:MAG TPA: AMIN domain-containing protein, partial [Steroidobacteraceae bacterium]|nr:AMIN domain-containing protein [Steroidobacteraceae bacterium]